ncbi:MAG: response regulator [Candidatus Omnitrophica bacterium]|nr:response regulator [Candidatus Omnitrophota bacterium]
MPKILVIDDEIDICEMFREFFSKRGYEVIYALTGRGGMDGFIVERPHIVTLDLCLNDINGLEILKAIKDIDPSCIVIIITGSASEDDRRKALALGADYYIAKPFSIARLNSLIAEVA